MQLFLCAAQLHIKVAGVQVQRTEHGEGRGHLPALPCQRDDVLRQLAGVELVHVFHLVPLRGGDGVAGDGQHLPHALGVQAQQQGLGGVQIAVAAGHVGQHVQPQLPVHPAGHQRRIHPCPGNGTVRNGQKVCTSSLQAACTVQIAGQVGILGAVQLNGDHLFARVQLAQEGIVFFHLRLCGSGDCCCRGCRQCFRQGIQCRTQGRNVGRRSAAAAAQNTHTLGSKAGQLPCKIFRPALILHPGACDHRVARVGHHCKRQLCLAKLLHQRTHGTGSRNAVQAHSIHCTAGSHAAHKLCAVTALAGVAVRQHCKGHQHKGIRHGLLDFFCRFGHTGIAAQRLKQKVLCTQCGKPLGKGRIDLCRRECLGVRGRAKIGKHGSAGLCSGLCSQFPAFVRHGLPHGVLRCCHARQAEGVGLDSIGTRFQIRAVHGQNAVRVQQVCLLTFLPGLCLIICTHAAIEQQRALF